MVWAENALPTVQLASAKLLSFVPSGRGGRRGRKPNRTTANRLLPPSPPDLVAFDVQQSLRWVARSKAAMGGVYTEVRAAGTPQTRHALRR